MPHTGTCLIDKITISYLARDVKINGEKMVKKRGGICTRIHALIMGRSSSGSPFRMF